MQQQQVLRLFDGVDGSQIGGVELFASHFEASHDRLRDADVRVAGQRRSHPALMKLKLGRTELQVMPFAERRVVDLPIVDESAVATIEIAHLPTSVDVLHNRMHARTERIVELDRAFRPATDAIFLIRVQHVVLADVTTKRHGEVAVNYGHRQGNQGVRAKR